VGLLGDDARGAEALGPLRDQEHAPLLDGAVDVVALVRAVRQVVVGHVVDVVLQQELGRDDPRTVLDDLVNPFAVAHALGALPGGQHREPLALVCLLVARHAHDEHNVGEGRLRLLQRAHVTDVEEVEDAVRVDPDRAALRRRVGLVAHGVDEAGFRGRLHAHRARLAALAVVVARNRRRAAALLARALFFVAVVVVLRLDTHALGRGAVRLGLSLLLNRDGLQDGVFGAFVGRIAGGGLHGVHGGFLGRRQSRGSLSLGRHAIVLRGLYISLRWTW
jgi:hypothetical protein